MKGSQQEVNHADLHFSLMILCGIWEVMVLFISCFFCYVNFLMDTGDFYSYWRCISWGKYSGDSPLETFTKRVTFLWTAYFCCKCWQLSKTGVYCCKDNFVNTQIAYMLYVFNFFWFLSFQLGYFSGQESVAVNSESLSCTNMVWIRCGYMITFILS